jgi:hypothetical protein
MTKWQFLTVTIDYQTFWAQVNGQNQQFYNINSFIDGFGQEGWELVSVVQNSLQPNLWGYFFKRPMI